MFLNKGKLFKTISFFLCTVFVSACFASALPVAAIPSAVSPKYFNSETLAQFSGVAAPETVGYSNIVINLETEAVIFDKKSTDLVYPASTVKIMTAIICFEEIEDLDVEITVSSIVKSASGKKTGFKEGEIFTASDLLHSLLLAGANDAALILAEYVGGTVDEFVELMNLKANKIGARSTHYTNPTGLHDSEMVTSARDTALIASYAYSIEEIKEISSLTNHYITPKNPDGKTRLLYNRNSFVSRSNGITEYYYNGAKGLAAGSTEQAGNCVVTMAQRSGLSYLCVVMSAPTTSGVINSYTDAKALLDACFEGFTNAEVINTAKMICELPIELVANVDHMTLYPETSLEALLPSILDPENDLIYERIIYNDEVEAPISKGERFGELIIKYKDDYTIGRVFLVADSNYERSNLLYFFSRVEDFLTSKFFIVTVISAVILTAAYIALTILGNRRKRMF